MKKAIFLKLAALTLLAVVAATGCKKTPKNVTPIHGQPTRITGDSRPTTINPDTNLNPPLVTPPPGLTPGGLPPGVTATPIPTVIPPPRSFDPDASQPPVEARGNMLVDRGAFAGNAIHFDYDKSVVKASEVGKLQPVIAALKAAPQNHLEVEGHCDERGTEEYNRALGERRALAIRAQLIKSGIAPNRISTISYGEDKPAALGHDEAAWARNRRGELLLLKPKN
jgi:peptidoglycan-associated lipoprotein